MYLILHNLIWKQYLCYIYEAELWVLRSGQSPLDDVTEMRYFILRYCIVTQLRSEYLYRRYFNTFCKGLVKKIAYTVDCEWNVSSTHTVLMCFVFIWEQTATCATYSINWLVFITEMKSVYSEVRTGPLNKAVCASSLKGLNCTLFSFKYNHANTTYVLNHLILGLIFVLI